MHVLVMTDKYPPVAVGGYERSCADVVAAWRADGHDVEVLTGQADGVPNAAGVHRELRIYGRRPPWRRVRSELANARAVRRALARRPDVISAWNLGRVSLGVLAAAARAGVPIVLVISDGWLATAPSEDPWMAAWSRRPRAARLVQALTTLPTVVPDLGKLASSVWVSEAIRDTTLATAPSWAPRRGTVIGSGIDLATFADGGHERVDAWGGRLLYVGRLAAAKGVDDAIAALAGLPPATTLDVVGAGDADRRRALDATARRLGVSDRVRWSVVDRADLPPRYRGADVVLFPSRWAEPFGLVPLEAMACGTPVVATGTGGSATFLHHEENCLLVPPGDPAAVAGAVARLAADPELRRRLAVAGRETAARHGIDDVARRLLRWHADPDGASVGLPDATTGHGIVALHRRDR